MSLLQSDSLSRLVSARPEGCQSVELYKALYRPDEGWYLQERFFPLGSQVAALEAILAAAPAGGSFLLVGPPATGKSVTLSMLARALSLEVSSAEFVHLMRLFDIRQGSERSALRAALEAARPPEGRWLVLIPHAESEQDFQAAIMRSLWAAKNHAEGESLPLGADLSAEFPDNLQDALDELIGSSRIDGVAVLIDKLESLFGSGWTVPDSSMPEQVRAFREMCRERDLPFVLVGALTRSVGQDPREETQLARSFRDILPLHLLTRKGEWEEFLAANVLAHQSAELWAELTSHPDLQRLLKSTLEAGTYHEHEADWCQEFALEGAYPLHPATTFLLPRLAMRLAAPQRTALSFFQEQAAGGLQYFLSNFAIAQPNGRLSLYTVDLLYSYFERQLKTDPRLQEAHGVLERALESSRDIPMARRLLRTVWLLQVGGQERVNTSPEHVIWSLHLGAREQPLAAQSLRSLVDRKILAFRNRRFWFDFEVERPSLDRLLRSDRRKIELEIDLLGLVERQVSSAPLRLSEINRAYSTDRFVRTRFVLPSQLDQLVAQAQQKEPGPGAYQGDLLLAYVVAQNPPERDQVAMLCQTELAHPRLVVGLPTTPTNYVAMAHDIEGLRRIRSADPAFSDPTSSEYLELADLLRQSEAELEESLCDLTDPQKLEFWHQRRCHGSLDAPGLERFLSQVVQGCIGPLTAVGDFCFSTTQDPASARARRYQAIDYLLGCGTRELVLRRGDYPALKALSTGLVESGLFLPVDEGGPWRRYRLRDPLPECGLGAALRFLLSRLLSEENCRQRLNPVDTVTALMRPPHSLPGPTVELLFGVAAWYWRDRLAFYRLGESAPTPMDGARIHELARHPAKWRVEHFEVPPEEQGFLEELLRLLKPEGPVSPDGSALQETADLLLSWFDRLPPTNLKLAYHRTPYASSLIDLLHQRERPPHPRRLLLQLLPAALGFPAPVRWEEAANTVLNRFENLRQVLEEAMLESRRQLHEGIRWIFADRVSLARQSTWPTLISRWYQTLPASVRSEPGNDELKLMLAAFSNASADEEESLDDLLHELGYPPMSTWDRDYADEVLERIRLARIEMEWQDYLGMYTEQRSAREKASGFIRRVLLNAGLPPEDVAELLQSELEQAAWSVRSR